MKKNSKYIENRICQYCSKEFIAYLPPSYLREGRGKTCSRQCAGLQSAKVSPQDTDAIIELAQDESISTKTIASRFGCSATKIRNVLRDAGCQRDKGNRGKANGRYRHGKFVNQHIYRSMIEKDKCAACGSVEQLCIHHINLDHYDNYIENLRVMCQSCHTSLHKTLYWQRVKAAR